MIDIGKLRKQAGLSQADIASKMKVSVATIRNWELERYKPGYAESILLKMIFSKRKRK